MEELDHDDIEGWLNSQPHEVVSVVAARAALRVLPLLRQLSVDGTRADAEVEAIVLQCFRATALPLVFGKYPKRVDQLRSAAHVSTATSFKVMMDLRGSDVLRLRPAFAAAYGAVATLSNRDNYDAADTAVNSAYDNPEAAREFSVDRNSLEFEAEANGLARQPLWRSGPPQQLLRMWRDLKSGLLRNGKNWGVWTRWYDAVLAGEPTPGDEELDIYRVMLDKEGDWQKGPAYVNALILKKEEEIAERSASESIMLGDRVEAEIRPSAIEDVVGQVGSSIASDAIEIERALMANVAVQNPVAMNFGTSPDGRVDVIASAGAVSVERDPDRVDSHSEVRRFADELIILHEAGREGTNNGNAKIAREARLLLDALGERIEDVRPGLLIPRGEALRQSLKADETRDSLSDIPPLSDGVLAALRNLVAAHNAFVSLSAELARRDQALLGPDAKRILIPPDDANSAAQTAVSMGAATQQAADAVAEDAAVAPKIPDAENRNSRRASETSRNFARAVFGRAQAFVRWIRQNPGKAVTRAGAGIGSMYAAAQWLLAKETWFLTYFADSPAALTAFRAIVAFLKTLPV